MDLATGERLVLSSGDLARAVRASMSIPVLFPPVVIDGRTLVDGGVVDNMPVGVARELGAQVVIAVDVSGEPLEPKDYRDALGVASQLTDLLTLKANEDFAREPDVYVRPDLGRHRSSDYSGFDAMIAAGYAAMQAAIPELRLALAEAGLPETLERRAPQEAPHQLDGTPIAEVIVVGNERSRDSVVRRTFNIPVGPPFSIRRSLLAFDKIEATGLFAHVWMRPERVPEGLLVALQVEDAPANRLEVGAAFNEWEKARGSLRLKALNSLGFGEETELLLAGSEAEILGSFSLRGDRLLVAGLGYRVSAFALKDKPRFYDENGVRLNRAAFTRRGLDARFQVPLERWGLVEAGLELGRVETNPIAGLDLEETIDSVRRLHGAVTVDVLDRLLWPSTGVRFAARGDWSPDALGGSRRYWRTSLALRLVRPLGPRWHLQLEALAGLSDGDVPAYDHYRLGGPRLVPGYHHEELKGPQVLASSLSVFLKALGALRIFARVGGGDVYPTREAIRLRDQRWGIAAGAVYPTRIGPVALEWGVRDGADSLITLAVGWN
jgi:NTE family protein